VERLSRNSADTLESSTDEVPVVVPLLLFFNGMDSKWGGHLRAKHGIGSKFGSDRLLDRIS